MEIYSYGKIKYKIVNDDEVAIIEYDGRWDRSVEIPTEIKGKKVTVIGYQAFYGLEMLGSLTIPEGVKAIERFAFKDCYNLKELKLPESLVRIEDNAFANCHLRKVTIPNSVKMLGHNAITSWGFVATKFIIPEKDFEFYDDSFGELARFSFKEEE